MLLSLLSWVVFLVCRASAIDVKETVICTGVQENGKLPTENEPKIGLSLQNVRTVKVHVYQTTKDSLEGGARTMYNGCLLPNS
ncbi:hypothetical protein Bca52824_075774 [Brassica carinata]|uniref:Uncharacterized protein n=1 Tax=Brassica carinata TaxID=52824 RepID=A0A8X7PSH5_BRACI|nr:hypothetical protein Bca52824_075774 [Brassica carinata]